MQRPRAVRGRALLVWILGAVVACADNPTALATGSGFATDPFPPNVPRSPLFRVQVAATGMPGAALESFVYYSNASRRAAEVPYQRANRSVSWTTFQLPEPGRAVSPDQVLVTVYVTLQAEPAWGGGMAAGLGVPECTLRPSSYGLVCARLNRTTFAFEVTAAAADRPLKVSVEYPAAYTLPYIQDAFLVFIDLPAPAPDCPPANCWRYGPGVHRLNGQLPIPEHISRIVVEAGAYVIGGFISQYTNQSVAITGRGILSGEDFAFHDPRFHWALLNLDKGQGHSVSDITVIDPPQFYFRTYAEGCVLTNLKLAVAWTYNTDGLVTGPNGVIRDCFIRSDDDSIKLYDPGMLVERLVLWQLQNGAAFQLGWWETSRRQSALVRDVDVIHAEWCTFGSLRHCHTSWNNALLDLAGSGVKTVAVHNLTFQDIRLEGPIARLVLLDLLGTAPTANGTIQGLRLDRVSLSQPTLLPSVLAGAPGRVAISDVQFRSLTIAGVCASSALQAGFAIDNRTVARTSFRC